MFVWCVTNHININFLSNIGNDIWRLQSHLMASENKLLVCAKTHIMCTLYLSLS